jgi:hypothetical protein
MIKRLAILVVFLAAFSLVLVACGDETASVPAYNGATAVTLSDSVKSQMSGSLTQIKNATVEGFKTTDDVNKIKSTFDSNFKSAGWDDKSSEFAGDDSIKQLTGMGMVVLGYQKGNKAAIVMALPNTFAEALGFSGLDKTENAIMVISGNQA